MYLSFTIHNQDLNQVRNVNVKKHQCMSRLRIQKTHFDVLSSYTSFICPNGKYDNGLQRIHFTKELIRNYKYMYLKAFWFC